ncbi:uncharacterized protein LOC115929328 [Strongylocentrotus purpuratus]|uniref:Uncharacterized protein n=1 Tax=Strongylocentrotus purpuratus TaxID=7668 RepID=A0A7M7PRF0_STRPU|nr:uncharacterized protein LOC115929328 [Strongylocentrotus purpuratus]
MKVSMILVCLALVPFVVAQTPPTEEEAGLWEYISGLFETDPIITIKEKAQVVIDNVKDTHVKVNDFFAELELPTIPGEDEYPTIEELDAQMRELSEKIEKRIQDAIDSIDFDAFNLDGEPEGESEHEAEPEPEPETPPRAKWYQW